MTVLNLANQLSWEFDWETSAYVQERTKLNIIFKNYMIRFKGWNEIFIGKKRSSKKKVEWSKSIGMGSHLRGVFEELCV